MALSKNVEDYDRTNERNKHGFTTRAAQKERVAMKRAARKFSRACQRLVIEEQVADIDPTWDQAWALADAAAVSRWHIDDVIELYEEFGSLPAGVVIQSQELYASFMEGVEFY